jgi:sulfotransferase
MNKTYNFLSGLPRSGNTLLSAILNQNPRFYSSPISPLAEYLYQMDTRLEMEECLRNDENINRTLSVLNSTTNTFYSDVKEPVIFDRNKNWTSPANFDLILKYITPEPKIIYTVRDYLDVLASYSLLGHGNIVSAIDAQGLYINYHMSKFDKIAEYANRLNSSLDLGMMCTRHALSPEIRPHVHFVEYEDLMNSPQETLNKIYEFLGEEKFAHDFNNIKKVEYDNEERVNHPHDTHRVAKTIEPSTTNPKAIFSDYILNKYSGYNIWRDNKEK